MARLPFTFTKHAIVLTFSVSILLITSFQILIVNFQFLTARILIIFFVSRYALSSVVHVLES